MYFESRVKPYPLLPFWESVLLSVFALHFSVTPFLGSLAYEFCFLLGTISALVQAVCVARRLQAISRARPITTTDRLRALGASQFTLLFPLAISILTTPLHPVCRWDIGFAWFGLLPMVSSFFGAASAIWATRNSVSPGGAIFWSLAPTLLFSLLTLLDLAFEPPLFFFHPAFGYFAGPIYDEWIPITKEVILFRAWTLLFSMALIFPLRFQRFALAVGLLPLLFRNELNWAASHKEIQRRLGSTITSGPIHLHYNVAKFPIAKAEEIATALETYATVSSKLLGIGNSTMKPIDVYLYPSAELKKIWTGTRYTMIGNPMQRALHILPTDPRNLLLLHEITHVVAAPIGIPGIGVSFRIALLEGLATAVEGERQGLSVHEWAAALKFFQALPNMNYVMIPQGFLRTQASHAYLASGSFCRWLIATRGIDQFKHIYRGGTFEEAYGESLQNLSEKWEHFLTSVPLTSRALDLARKEVKERPIFERRCPHDVAEAIEQGRRCQSMGNNDCAKRHFKSAKEWKGEDVED